jgi:hypothetical protein
VKYGLGERVIKIKKKKVYLYCRIGNNVSRLDEVGKD